MYFDADTIRQTVEFIHNFLAGILFPARCPVCDGILLPQMRICSACDVQVKRIREPVCKRCGKPLEDERREYCSDCERKRHYFTQGKAVFVYEGGIRQSLYRFKYSNKREYAGFYADEANRLYHEWLIERNIEVIIPIPMYIWKQRLRGYNQAEVFARALEKDTGIPVDTQLIRRIRNTTPQKKLSDVERRGNLKNAFQLRSDIVKYKQIILVDDIYTTGSTMDAVAKILVAAGVEEVYFICISIGKGY